MRSPSAYIVPVPAGIAGYLVSGTVILPASVEPVSYYVTPGPNMIMRYGLIRGTAGPGPPPSVGSSDIIYAHPGHTTSVGNSIVGHL